MLSRCCYPVVMKRLLRPERSGVSAHVMEEGQGIEDYWEGRRAVKCEIRGLWMLLMSGNK